MKITLELNLNETEVDAISRTYLGGQTMTPEFLNEFVKKSVKKLVDDAMIYDVATSGLFPAMEE